jgi:hypothetical protein
MPNYLVSVRQRVTVAKASFRPLFAETPLPSHSGRVPTTAEDFHLRERAHARRTKNAPSAAKRKPGRGILICTDTADELYAEFTWSRSDCRQNLAQPMRPLIRQFGLAQPLGLGILRFDLDE